MNASDFWVCVGDCLRQPKSSTVRIHPSGLNDDTFWLGFMKFWLVAIKLRIFRNEFQIRNIEDIRIYLSNGFKLDFIEMDFQKHFLVARAFFIKKN